MKTCVRCQVEKPITEYRRYSRSKDGYEAACKSCRRSYDNQSYRSNPERRQAIQANNRATRKRLAQYVRDHLNQNPCVDCGQSDPDLLEFDHVRGTKVSDICKMVLSVVPFERLQAEIEKCDVRCLYCHRKRTIKQFGWHAGLV